MRCAGEYMRLMKAVAQEDGQSTFFQGQKASRGLAFARRKRWALDVFVRNAQLVEFPACLAKLELERVQLTLKAARGRRRGNGPVAFIRENELAAAAAATAACGAGKMSSSMHVSRAFSGKTGKQPGERRAAQNSGKISSSAKHWAIKWRHGYTTDSGKFPLLP